jgi:hypothetical protein
MDKSTFKGAIISIQPRIRLMRSLVQYLQQEKR